MLESFTDELIKISEVNYSHTRKGVRITGSTDEFMEHLQPGDIIATKFSGKPDLIAKAIGMAQKIKGFSKEVSSWTHLGMYVGDGKIRHAYTGLRSFKASGKSKVRDHKVKTLASVGRDMLILRPSATLKSKLKAVKRTDDLLGKEYSTKKALRTVIFPGASNKKEFTDLPSDIICTAIPAYGYSKMLFGKGKSIHNLLPGEFVTAKNIKQILAYSKEG